jgi:ribosome-binding factor A
MSLRTERYQRMVQEELSLLIDGLSDPRVSEAGLFTVTHVAVAPDLGSAKVYVTLESGDEAAEQQLLEGLESAVPYLRRELSRSIQSKKAPDLHFYIDEAKERADRVEALLKEIAEEKVAARDTPSPPAQGKAKS